MKLYVHIEYRKISDYNLFMQATNNKSVKMSECPTI